MENEENVSYRALENRPYRYLQQMAKSIGLPSNFKKVYLIELIQAKKFKTDREVNTIIKRVKLERLRLSKSKRESNRRKMQVSEMLANSSSPPITITPKRPSQCTNYNPELRRTLLTYNPKRNLNMNQPPNTSDRILRSFNMKTLKPNYALLNGDDIRPSKETKIKIITNGGFPQFNVTAVRKRPNVLNAINTQYMLAQSSDFLHNTVPSKRQRTISGIYPLEPIPRHIHTTENVCVRKIDGSITKINALVQKRMDIVPKPKNRLKSTEINIQDIIDTIDANIDLTENNNNCIQISYPNLSSLDTCSTNNTQAVDSIKDSDVYSVYYHKKIRSEQIRCQKIREMEHERLPKIGDVFSKFNNVYRRDFSQPLYIQVSTEAERSQNHPIYMNRVQPNTIVLEPLFNFKSQYDTPLLQIATTSSTVCVYTTPIVTTPVALPSTIMCNEAYVPSFEADNLSQSDIDPRLHEFLQFSEQNNLRRNCGRSEDFSTSASSQDTSACSIPEMVEDALEIISQDGDYMKQIAMDVKGQCVLCTWAGPRILLEYHIKKEHIDQIHKHYKSEWNLTYTLGNLVQNSLWLSQLIEHDSTLFVLSAKYEDPDCFMASLSSLSSDTQKFGSITIYNKVSGEPFSWTGHIQPLSPNLPHGNDTNCLKTELSRLNLLPNSANLKLINRELVCDSPNKVVVGQPMLNDIHLILFVRIFN